MVGRGEDGAGLCATSPLCDTVDPWEAEFPDWDRPFYNAANFSFAKCRPLTWTWRKCSVQLRLQLHAELLRDNVS